ncbi:RNA polymerase sigma factor [Paenibacillus campinasensis]|uniref:RNA polymerase subunit sigma-24 n=1 Tax=Paenibacillus campinasensis TaxID=66347 RepID=A0A268F4F2_9BACL|nr:sigma-70 family RNA polymerase sigma factor [Paenibacillus campinasensis]PAD80252.1 RNA polymerase subunit sigma-24 [Paenibacillus campinasensis]
MNDNPEIWLAEIAEGSAAAFGRFYEAYAKMVYRLAFQFTKDAAEAEDLCQDIFMEVLHKAEQYDPDRGSVEAWLAVRTRCRAMDRLRRKQRLAITEWSEDTLPETLWTGEREAVEVAALRQVELEQVKKALKTIPPMQRMAVYGSYVEQMSHREMAELMKRPVGTVKSLIRYGIQNVRKRLDIVSGKEGGGSEHETFKVRP